MSENRKERSDSEAIQVRGMEVLLQQNAALEKEVERLCADLDEITHGVHKKGYLFKWREQEIYYAAKWGMRYFVLQGNQISYYGDENDYKPRRTIDLSKCFVREDGKKKGGLYHVFSIHLGNVETYNPDDQFNNTLLLRLSTKSAADAAQWIETLEQACSMKDRRYRVNSTGENSPKQEQDDENDGQDWGNVAIETEQLKDDASYPLAAEVMKRVASGSLVLKKSKSRQSFLKKKANDNFTSSGSRISELAKGSWSPKKPNSKTKTDIHKIFPGFKPMHLQNLMSPLSSENRAGEINYRGFFNLGVLILVISHFDLIVNNMLKYGLKITLPFITATPTFAETCTADICPDQGIPVYINIPLALFSWFTSISANYSLELIASRGYFSENVIFFLNFIISMCHFIFPCLFVWRSVAHPMAKMVYLFQSVIIWMKLFSYAHANRDLRKNYFRSKQRELESLQSSISKDSTDEKLEIYPSLTADKPGQLKRSSSGALSEKEVIEHILSEIKDLQPPFLLYPQNLTFKNLLYFCVAPTLCYQLNYPRSEKIRWSHVLTLVLRIVFVGLLIVFSFEQYIRPTLEGTVIPISELNVPMILERLLKLSIPNTYVWLLGFYVYFHLWLNLLAELTRFGDRQFYKEWWNARTVDAYWRLWNLPVHYWITRHFYKPLLRRGVSKMLGFVLVFAFSALLHEVIISLPFHTISFHAFFGMLGQVPLIMITKYLDRKFDNSFLGNAFFWMAFCIVGQPMGIIMYYYDMWKQSEL